MTKHIRLALIGAGNRGSGVFGQYALNMPHRVSFTHVVEPDASRRERFSQIHAIPLSNCFASSEAFFTSDLSGIDGVVIATLDDHRLAPLAGAITHNLPILIEKPLCTTPQELLQVQNHTRSYRQICVVCHQLRLTPAYLTIKRLIDSGDLGSITAIAHEENVSYAHMAHSLVRGYLHQRRGPILLAKCCHDFDLLTWLVGSPPARISSFASLNHFTRANAPSGAPAFCLDGCPHAVTCPYDVAKAYFSDHTDPAWIRQMGVIDSRSQLLQALKSNRFGRCVYQVGDQAVDSQAAIIQFQNNVNVSFLLTGHNASERRRTKISLTNGEISYDSSFPVVHAHAFHPNLSSQHSVQSSGTHHGGDQAIMDAFIHAIATGDHSGLLTPIHSSFDGHFLVFAAEHSRYSGQTVSFPEYLQSLQTHAQNLGSQSCQSHPGSLSLDSITSPEYISTEPLMSPISSIDSAASSKPFSRAFTLIELLVVITILSVLIALMLPSLSKAREQAKIARCLANQRQIALGGPMYASDNNGLFPAKYNDDGATPSANTGFMDFSIAAMRFYTNGDWVTFTYNATSKQYSMSAPFNGPAIFICPNNVNPSALWGGKWKTSYGLNCDARGGWARRLNQYRVKFYDVPKPSSKVFGMDWAGTWLRTDAYNSGVSATFTFGGSYVPGIGAYGAVATGTWITQGEYQDFYEGRHGLYVNVVYMDGHAATLASRPVISAWHVAGTPAIGDPNIYTRANNMFAVAGN